MLDKQVAFHRRGILGYRQIQSSNEVRIRRTWLLIIQVRSVVELADNDLPDKVPNVRNIRGFNSGGNLILRWLQVCCRDTGTRLRELINCTAPRLPPVAHID